MVVSSKDEAALGVEGDAGGGDGGAGALALNAVRASQAVGLTVVTTDESKEEEEDGDGDGEEEAEQHDGGAEGFAKGGAEEAPGAVGAPGAELGADEGEQNQGGEGLSNYGKMEEDVEVSVEGDAAASDNDDDDDDDDTTEDPLGPEDGDELGAAMGPGGRVREVSRLRAAALFAVGTMVAFGAARHLQRHRLVAQDFAVDFNPEQLRPRGDFAGDVFWQNHHRTGTSAATPVLPRTNTHPLPVPGNIPFSPDEKPYRRGPPGEELPQGPPHLGRELWAQVPRGGTATAVPSGRDARAPQEHSSFVVIFLAVAVTVVAILFFLR